MNLKDELKKQLEMRRRQRAAHGVVENHADLEDEVDPVEENLRTLIEQEKKDYKRTVDRLKALRTEIEHLQLLLERSKVKLQRDFQKWWSVEASLLQELEATARGHTASLTMQPTSSEFGSMLSQDYLVSRAADTGCPTSVQDFRSPTPKQGSPVTAVPAWVDELTHRIVTDRTTSSQLRDLSKVNMTTSIPLTGDKKADADIMAFVKAREKLLQRTGQALK